MGEMASARVVGRRPEPGDVVVDTGGGGGGRRMTLEGRARAFRASHQ